MRTKILLLLCLNVFVSALSGQKISNYILNIEKRNDDAANLHFDCSFDIDFGLADSVCMNFGGDKDFSIDNLMVQEASGLNFYYNSVQQRIVFLRSNKALATVEMNYDYTNLTSFFIYGKGNAELWETSYREYYYPYLPNTYMDMEVSVHIPDSLSFICAYSTNRSTREKYSCHLKNILAQSFVFAFLQKGAYTQTAASIPDTIEMYQINGMECTTERYNDFVTLVRSSLDYFSRKYGETYCSSSLNITNYPTFLFHNGEGFSNRYNLGFISASQEKFSTYPDIYPLIHEIGHRWLGEWTLLIDDGKPGAYFIKESLNEFMTLMFIREKIGIATYDTLMKRCKYEYQKIENTENDIPLIRVTNNNNNTLVYYKGPLILDSIAQKIGYDNLISIIVQFYHLYKCKYPINCYDFTDLLKTQFLEAGDELIAKLTE